MVLALRTWTVKLMGLFLSIWAKKKCKSGWFPGSEEAHSLLLQFLKTAYPGIQNGHQAINTFGKMNSHNPEASIESEVLKEAENDCLKPSEVPNTRSLYFRCINLKYYLASFQYGAQSYSCYKADKVTTDFKHNLKKIK